MRDGWLWAGPSRRARHGRIANQVVARELAGERRARRVVLDRRARLGYGSP
jgi:hypothetical protein